MNTRAWLRLVAVTAVALAPGTAFAQPAGGFVGAFAYRTRS